LNLSGGFGSTDLKIRHSSNQPKSESRAESGVSVP
jgi:hypothetical protein